MKEKSLIIQDTKKSLTAKKEESKNLIVKEEKEKRLKTISKKETALTKNSKKEVALTKSPKKETALQKTSQPKKATAKTSETKTKKASKDTAIKKTAKKTTKVTKTSSTTSTTKKKSTSSTTKNTKTRTSTKKATQDFTAHANEYFDLPYRYNETLVKLLAQTPKRLFVYWDISDKDVEIYINAFGKDFFNNTIPFLRIKNETKNYTFDVEINDFANSWYININDDNSKYSIELYRKFKENVIETTPNVSIQGFSKENNTIFIASSNKMEAPNGKVISTTYPRIIEYKNIKTNESFFKEITGPNKEFNKLFFNDEDYNINLNASSSSL